jgi:hypothetical protein
MKLIPTLEKARIRDLERIRVEIVSLHERFRRSLNFLKGMSDVGDYAALESVFQKLEDDNKALMLALGAAMRGEEP